MRSCCAPLGEGGRGSRAGYEWRGSVGIPVKKKVSVQVMEWIIECSNPGRYVKSECAGNGLDS